MLIVLIGSLELKLPARVMSTEPQNTYYVGTVPYKITEYYGILKMKVVIVRKVLFYIEYPQNWCLIDILFAQALRKCILYSIHTSRSKGRCKVPLHHGAFGTSPICLMPSLATPHLLFRLKNVRNATGCCEWHRSHRFVKYYVLCM